MLKYNLLENDKGITIARNNEDGSISFIPSDLSNSDYQEYLAWIENPQAEQSTPIVEVE